MKSLDDLIRHLIEEIALCGDYGAGTLDFVGYVNEYYCKRLSPDAETPSCSHRNPSVDRKFLEKVWEWLTRHPEIEVGEAGWANKLSLSEVECRRAATEERGSQALDDASSTPLQHEDGSAAPFSVRAKSKTSNNEPSGTPNERSPSRAQATIRIYASSERRWHAITGHAPDPIKIPRLDFACLSIIAAHKEQGVLQPDLVRISGQDKRSVPERTRRLHEAGYISKVPVLVNKSHTSRLTLKRYVREPLHHGQAAETADNMEDVLRPGKNSVENPIDFLALQHKIFDILREVKLITFNELKKKLGITGLPWPMRLFASYLRRLEYFGCIKQVRARPDIEATTPFLFRCVKYIRDPEGKEWLPTHFLSRHRSKDAGAEGIEANGLVGGEADYEAEEAGHPAGHGGESHIHNLKEVERQVPQWSGDGTLSNLLYDLVHASGQNGLSTMDLKNRSMGCFNLRPTENHLSRVAEMWQMSQPLHLRHLSIIRDAALTDGIPHYVHYSFENFKTLVDEGKASWKSVMTITEEHKDFETTAAMEAQPELDDNGFPKLSSNLFQGRHNDASLAECVRGPGPLPLPRSWIDAKALKSREGVWTVRSGSRYHPPRSKAQIKDTSAQSHLEEVPEVRVKRPRKLRGEPNLLVTQAGRARKVPKEGLPPGFSRMTWAEKKKVLHLQDAAKLYKKIKIVKAIEKQVGEGGDRYETTAAVLNLAIVQYRNAGEEPPWDLMEEVRLAALVPSLLALQLSKHSPTLNSATKGHNNGLGILDFRPSVAAHTRPLQPTEIGVVEDILKARTHALEVIPIDESIKKTTAEILAQAIQNSTSAIGISSHRFQKELLGKRSRGQQKQKPIHAVDDPSSNVTVAPSLPSAGKRKYKRVKDLSTHTGDTPKQYLPSVAAHTWPDASNQSSLAIKKQSKPGKRKYKRVENFIECHGDLSTHTGNIPKQYLPSIAAHTWPVASNESTIAIKEQPKSGKRKYNRKKKSTAPIDLTSTSAMPGNLNRQLGSLATLIEGIADHYLPSVAAHTWPVTPYGLTTEALPAKRKLDSVEPTQRKRQKKASWKMTQLDLTPDANSPTRTPQARQRLETQTYEQQLKNIPRPISGCYVGKLVNLAQPGKRGPKRKSQLAVLKSPGIHWLACFSTEASMAGAATQVPYQQPAAENQRSSHEAIVTDAMNTDIPPAAGMPDEASSACVTQQGVSPPLPVSRTGTVRQSEGGGVLDQLDPIPQQQNNTAPTSPNITEITGLTMPEAPHPLEHSTGAKRKRSTNDEAGRDAAYPPPRLAAFDHAMASTSDSTRTATEPKEPTAEDGAAPSATDTPILSPGSYVLVPALAGEASEPHNEHTPPTQSPIDLNRSEPHAIQPESVQQQGDDDRTADTHAQPHLPLAAGNQFTESDPSSNGIIEIQEQQAPTPCIQRFQANINTTPSISIRIHRQNPPNDPFPADREAMHDVPEDASSVADVEAGDPVAPSNYRSVSPRPGPPEKEVEEGNDMMFGRSSLDQSVRDLHSAASEASLPQVLVDDSTEPKGKKGIQKMRPQGGSIAAQRRKIVMDIIERCGGIYPGVSELAVPFKEQWSNSGYPGTAERSTLKGVVDYLCGINKLRQLTFFFKDLRGLAVKKTMIIKFDINTTDPRISAMRQKIERKHPTWYFPDEVGISDEVRDTYWNPKGPMKNRTVKDLEVDEERVQLQQKPGYIERYEVKEKARQERMAHQEQQAAMMRALMAEGNLYDRSILGSLGTPHKRRRLLTTARKTGLTGPRPKVNRLTSLQKGPAASAGDHDEGTLPPADRDSFRKFSQATGQEGASQRLWEMHKMKSPQSRKSLTFTPVLGIENFESAFESQRLEEKRHVDAIERITAANAAEGMAYEPELPPSSSARPEIRTFQLSNKGLSSVPDTDPETPQTARGRKSLHPDRHSRAARQQMFTIMEPEHVFHPATGTFSINFSPYRTHNQSKRKNHWQRPPFKAFDDYIDDCQRYELRERGLKDANFRNWPFVNFTFPHRHETPVGPSVYFKRPRFSSQCLTDRTPDQQLLADLAAAESRTVPASNHVPAKRKRSIYDGPFKTRRLTAVEKLSQNSQQKSLGPVLEEPGFDQIYRSLPHLRRGQKLAPEFIQRMLTAVTVVRMLTGGIDSHIDWVLVTRAFQPEYDQAYVQGAWPKVLQQHRVQAEMVRTRFQQMFLDAYEKGLVPPLDYDNLEAYDWPWLIDWTIENLDTPIEAAPNLPLQRDELDQVFDFEVGEDRGMSTYYEFCTGSARVERREAELHKQAWVVPLSNKPKAEPIANGNDLELAKNWVRANVSTKEDVYRPRAAADKLLRFDAKTRDRALTQLQSEGVIMHRNKGRSMPGCQYDLTQKYLKPLKKKIETGHLRNAAMFKRQIDEALASEGEMIIPQVADDAFMLAVQNMQAHRKLSFVPKNPPMEKFGLGGVGNYRVRQIPKSKYHFDVGLQATDGYVKGNPLLPLPEPPSVSQSEAEKEKIPLWYNIHGDFDKDLWEEAVAAIMSILVIRPGASVDVVEPSVRPTLGLWEVQMLLDWMVEAGAARKMGNSYVTEEWWWLCLDSGRTFDEDKKYKAEKERMKEPEQLREEGKSKEEGLREGNGEQRGEVEDGEDREDVQMEDV